MSEDNKGYRLIVLDGQPDITFGVKDDMGCSFMLIRPTYGSDLRTVAEEKIFLEGDVYIMNEDGKNISKFEVGAKPPMEMSAELKGLLTKTQAVYSEPQVFTQANGKLVFNGLGNPILIFNKGDPIESSPKSGAWANVTPLYVSNIPMNTSKDIGVVYQDQFILLKSLPASLCSIHSLWCTPEIYGVILRENLWPLENINIIHDKEICAFIKEEDSTLKHKEIQERIVGMLIKEFAAENFKAIQKATHQTPEDYAYYENDVPARDDNGRVIFDAEGNTVLKHKKGDVILDKLLSTGVLPPPKHP